MPVITTATTSAVTLSTANDTLIVASSGSINSLSPTAVYVNASGQNIVVSGQIIQANSLGNGVAVLVNSSIVANNTHVTVTSTGSIIAAGGYNIAISLNNAFSTNNLFLDNAGLIQSTGVGFTSYAIFCGTANDTISNTGNILGTVGLFGGSNILKNDGGTIEGFGGTLNPNVIFFGEGDDTFTNTYGTITGSIIFGDGFNTASNTYGRIYGGVTGGANPDTISNLNGVISGIVNLGQGNNSFDNSRGTLTGDFVGGAANDVLINSYGTVNGGVYMGDATGGTQNYIDNSFGVINGSLFGGTGNNNFVNKNGIINGNVGTGDGFNVFDNSSGLVRGYYNGGVGIDQINNLGGVFASFINLGGGNDSILIDASNVGGTDSIFGGAGKDLLDLSSATAAFWVDLEYTQMEVWTSGAGIANGATANTMIANLDSFEDIYGSVGSDVILGNSSDNTFVWTGNVPGTADVFFGRGGVDTIDLSALKSIWVDLALSANEVYTNGLDAAQGFNSNTLVANLDSVERIIGTAGSDEIFGDAGDNIFVSNGVALDGQVNIPVPVPLALDRFDGRLGSDTIDLSSLNLFGAVWVDLTSNIEVWQAVGLVQATGANANTQIADLTSVENVVGTFLTDQFYGDGNNNSYGYNGKVQGIEFIDGRGGSDTFDGSRSTTSLWIGLTNTAVEVWSVGSTANSNGANANTQIADLVSIENIVGSQYGDTLLGDTGNNRIEGGKGDDTLAGFGGNDTFVFKFDTVNGVGVGTDTINDFSAGAGVGDVVELASYGINANSFAELMAASTNTAQGVLIQFIDGSSINLLGLTKAQLSVDDFVFA
jgi:RTX calcium-binding nonapeptide repeat (4 copies)